MICGGDEMGRTQGGNNNAYAQDNEISWLNWELNEADQQLLEFTRRVAALRLRHPVFHRRHFFQGRRIRGSELEDITWLRPDGYEMTEGEWNGGGTRCFGMRLGGDAMLEWDDRGERVLDDTFLLIFNGGTETSTFTLPNSLAGASWETVISTADPFPAQPPQNLPGGGGCQVEGRSVTVLRRAM
jgi:glycogen operon protein